jgi:hypothetical protein
MAQMTLVREAAELGLSARDKAGIKIRQMLAKADFSGGFDPGEEYTAILKDELNLQVINWQGGESNLEIDLDTNITPELKIEGHKRELIRTINLLRKDAGLTASDQIDIYLSSKDDLVPWLIEVSEALKKSTIADHINLQSVDRAEAEKEIYLEEIKLLVQIRKIEKSDK